MRKQMAFLSAGLVVLASGSTAFGVRPLQQDPRRDGIVAVEAEDYDSQEERPPHAGPRLCGVEWIRSASG